MKKWILLIFVLILVAGPVFATEEKSPGPYDKTSVESSPAKETAEPTATGETQTEAPEHGFGHKLLFYIPNRMLDVFDIIRLRLRVGPGLAAGVRATKPLTLSIGGYTSIYAGLPGPRQEPIIKLPIGIENYAGMEASILDASNKGRFSPNYSPTEIGASVHPLILGLDMDVDPLEVLDLALGFLFIDIRGDDL